MEKTAISFFDQLLRIKSYNSAGKMKCAELITHKLENIGFNVENYFCNGAPIIFGYLDIGASSDILFYSHYDVKPEGNLGEWNTEPFTPFYDCHEKKIYARGAGDDKGQVFATIMGIESAIKGDLPLVHNITVLIEGNEENGSIGLEEFCIEKMIDKHYTAVIINDSHWLNNEPVLYTGARGQQTIKVTYDVLELTESLHAGNFGGLQTGAARKLIEILNGILNEIDEVVKIFPTSNKNYGNAVSVTYFTSGESERSTLPKRAVAKLDIRFVDISLIEKVNLILEKAEQSYNLHYTTEQLEEGYFNKPDEQFIEKSISIVKRITGKKLQVRDYCGAYLPMRKLQCINGIKYVIPFAQTDECNHAPNENIKIENIIYGIEFVKGIITQ